MSTPKNDIPKNDAPKNTRGNTIRLHRVLAAPSERVYRAFTDPDALAKWMSPHGFTTKVHEMDVRVGGGYRISFTNFTTRNAHTFGGKYIEIKPNQLLKYTDQFENPNLPGEIQVTIQFRQVSCGTDLQIVQEGVPEAIPVEQCYLGWQQSLYLLAQLVQPEIAD